MRIIKKILILTLSTILIVVVIVFFLLKSKSPGTTTDFVDSSGQNIENSIAEMQYMEIGGVNQFMLTRGKNIENPILLILHGGPGNSELPMFRYHNADLENEFIVAYWEQRGAGKSVELGEIEKTFTIEQFVQDAHEVTQYLKAQFNKEKIYLLGHSWGSQLGVLLASKFPEDYLAFIGTGQVGDNYKNDELAYEFLVRKLTETNQTDELEQLKSYGNFHNKPIDKDMLNYQFMLSQYGGFYDYATGGKEIFFMPMVACKEYTLKEKLSMLSGNNFESILNSPNINLFDDVSQTNLLEEAPELKVPIYILQGKYDYVTNYDVAKMYFDSLKAPAKEFITFEKSGHFPAFEEAQKFNEYLINLKN